MGRSRDASSAPCRTCHGTSGRRGRRPASAFPIRSSRHVRPPTPQSGRPARHRPTPPRTGPTVGSGCACLPPPRRGRPRDRQPVRRSTSLSQSGRRTENNESSWDDCTADDRAGRPRRGGGWRGRRRPGGKASPTLWRRRLMNRSMGDVGSIRFSCSCCIPGFAGKLEFNLRFTLAVAPVDPQIPGLVLPQ